MNEKEAKQIVSVGLCHQKALCCVAQGYLEAIGKAKGLELFAKSFTNGRWAHNDKTDEDDCVVCRAENALAQWKKEK